MRKATLAGLSALALFAFSCGGGGGGGDIGLPVGSGGGGGGTISITSLSISPSNNIQVGNTYSISWSVSLSGSATGNYHIEFFEYDKPEIPSSLTGFYRIAQSNCGPGFQSFTGCGSSGVLECEVRNLLGTPSTLCKVRGSTASPTSKAITTRGNGYIVVRACNDLFTNCTVRTLQVTFPQ